MKNTYIDCIRENINKIDGLIAAIKRQNADVDVVLASVTAKYTWLFDDCQPLQDAIAALSVSQKFGADDGGIYRWVDYQDAFSVDAIPYLVDYLDDRSIYRTGCQLITYIGPAIVIDVDGAVRDQDEIRTVVRWADYQDDDIKRAYLIEQYMDQVGRYPGVFKRDQHGNVFLIDTVELAKQFKPEGDAK